MFPTDVDLTQLDGQSDHSGLAEQLGGIDVGMTAWRLVLIGNRPEAVTITNMSRVAEGDCVTPPGGAYSPDNTQGEQRITQLYIQVDAPAPVFLDADPRVRRGVPSFPDRITTVIGDPLPVSIARSRL